MKRSRSSGKKMVEFKFRAEPGKNVFVAGTFDNWDPRSLSVRRFFIVVTA